MELLDISKKLRREIKKIGISIEKDIKEINKESRVLRGAATGGIKEKREINMNALTKLHTVLSEFVNHITHITTTDVKEGFRFSAYVTLDPKKHIISRYDINMLKGKITLNEIVLMSVATNENGAVFEPVSDTFTLKEVKDSLKAKSE